LVDVIRVKVAVGVPDFVQDEIQTCADGGYVNNYRQVDGEIDYFKAAPIPSAVTLR
jgi:hypothetical protein